MTNHHADFTVQPDTPVEPLVPATTPESRATKIEDYLDEMQRKAVRIHALITAAELCIDETQQATTLRGVLETARDLAHQMNHGLDSISRP
ncbi:hypothetical protein [Paracoccus siganidrum]|uniref:hypothetical protein n=1 Tax=Paracoccus siganidrum TaxID=1276757 RepID=UPI000E71FAC5|nr:hypothetical protein [Paracoccus siganidrum]RMC30088.1 hypothetical protein C9E82_18920 [Paracoccus siganidrum]